MELFDRLFALRLTADSVQLNVSSDLRWIALMLGSIVVGLAVVHTVQGSALRALKERNPQES